MAEWEETQEDRTITPSPPLLRIDKIAINGAEQGGRRAKTVPVRGCRSPGHRSSGGLLTREITPDCK